ncbi:MAG: heme-binding protein [Asgard group archaeon]|nr:heme-binding protein [Asgard group archaeon]
MVETAKFQVIRRDGDFEIRKYDRMLLATVKNAPSRFRVLFNYITGSNKSKKKVAMTSPVITSEEIAMTSPVLSNNESMSFFVPSEYTQETVPEPTDERITINEVPERYIAIIRFNGLAWKNSVKKQTTRLLDWLKTGDVELNGTPFLMQYNPPYVPGFLRRNEIGIEVKYHD